MKSIKINRRVVCRLGISFVENLEKHENTTWIGNRRYQQAALRGIPRKILSLVIPEDFDFSFSEGKTFLVEIGEKVGKHSGNRRSHLAVRDPELVPVGSMPNIDYLENCTLICWASGDQGVVAIKNDHDQTEQVIFRGKLLRTKAISSADGAQQIIRWHWTKFFCHLKWDEISDLIENFDLIDEEETLTVANRRAGRALYERSRELGWRKMTLRERQKYGLDGAQWQKISTIEALASKTGCGEFTLTAARMSDNQ